MREEEPLAGNYVKLTITDLSGKEQQTFAYLTNYKISGNNAPAIVEAGRRRWKIENEGHNTLKTQGYNFEKNYGHGKANLCQLMANMKLISLAIHTILDYVSQGGLARVRQRYTSKAKAMGIIRQLFWMKKCKNWEQLYRYATEGLDSS